MNKIIFFIEMIIIMVSVFLTLLNIKDYSERRKMNDRYKITKEGYEKVSEVK